MKYITNDECHSVLSTVGSMDKVKKAYSECSSGCSGAHYVFFENGRYQYDLQTYKGALVDIRESYWTKPILLFTYKDSDVNKREELVYCYREFDSIGIERLVKGEIKMTHTIKNFDEEYDEIRNNEEYNKRFLSEAEKELKQIKDTNGHITDSDIAKVLGF